MDYPKSVPGVGLVGGKFVDENTATGQQGSLIPSVWGNAVTEEISNVIKDAGDVPAEGDLSQLQKAIRKIVALVWPKASDAEVAAGGVDDKVVTPKTMRAGFAISKATTGYIAFPTWLGGWVVQWGTNGVAALSTVTYTFPLMFPVTCASLVTSFGVPASDTANGQPFSRAQYQIQNRFSGTQTVYWIAVGY